MKYSLGPKEPNGLSGVGPGKISQGSRGRSRFPGGTPGAYSLKPSGECTPGPNGGGSGQDQKAYQAEVAVHIQQVVVEALPQGSP